MSLLLAELEKYPQCVHLASDVSGEKLRSTSPVYITEPSPLYGFMTCAASYARDMPSKLKSLVVKTREGNHKAWSDLPSEIIHTQLKDASTGPGQGE